MISGTSYQKMKRIQTFSSIAIPLTNSVKHSGVLSGWKPAIHDRTGVVTSSSREAGGVAFSSFSAVGVRLDEIEMMGPPALLTLGHVIN